MDVVHNLYDALGYGTKSVRTGGTKIFRECVCLGGSGKSHQLDTAEAKSLDNTQNADDDTRLMPVEQTALPTATSVGVHGCSVEQSQDDAVAALRQALVAEDVVQAEQLYSEACGCGLKPSVSDYADLLALCLNKKRDLPSRPPGT